MVQITEVSNRVTLGFNANDADFFLRLVGTGGSFDNAIQFFTGGAAKWAMGYTDNSSTTFRINAGADLDDDVLQLTDAGNLTVDGTVTANSVTLTGAPTKTDIDALDITEVGALDSGSITSGFGAIDNGSSNITTTGALDISGGTLTTSAAQKKTIIEGAGSNVDFGPYDVRSRTLQSDVATGTAPLTIASTTVVANLNADKLDGADLVDEDDMSSDSATKVPTQQSVKAYVDSTKVSLTGNETIAGQKTFSQDGDPSVIIQDPNGSNLLRLLRTDTSARFDISLEGSDLRFTPNTTDGTQNVLIGVNAASSTIDSRLGVGDATPSEMLSVTGNADISGNIINATWTGDVIANDYVAALPTSKITSGTFDDARIAASNVTQHQDSLTSATVTGASLTSSASDDKLISATQNLNVSAGSLGTQEYRMIKTNLTEQNAGGWDKIYLIDQQVDGTSKFNVTNAGTATFAGLVTSSAGTCSGSSFRQIINGGFNYGSAGGTKVYFPLTGYIFERTSTIAGNEYISYVTPYDGYLNQVVVRSEEACGSTVVGLHKSSTGTEVPNSTAAATVTVDMSADDTAYKFAFSSSNTFSAGDIITILFDPTKDANDTNFTVELIMDSTQGL